MIKQQPDPVEISVRRTEIRTIVFKFELDDDEDANAYDGETDELTPDTGILTLQQTGTSYEVTRFETNATSIEIGKALTHKMLEKLTSFAKKEDVIVYWHMCLSKSNNAEE